MEQFVKGLADTAELLALTCFNVDFDIMVAVVHDCFSDREQPGGYKVSIGRVDLSRARAGQPQAGGRHPATALIYRPRAYADRCVFIANMSDGWYTGVNMLARELHADCLSLRTSGLEVKYSINDLRIYRLGQEIRYVRAFKDGSQWEFFEKGERLGIESTSNYGKRRIRDRFNKEGLIETARAAGWNMRDPDLWQSDYPAIYIDELR